MQVLDNIETAGYKQALVIDSNQVKSVEVHKHADPRCILTVTEKGYGKRTEVAEFRNQKRGGKGLPAMKCNSKTGPIVGALLVHADTDVMIMTRQGSMIRTPVDAISVHGRKTQGVRLINLDPGDLVTGVVEVPKEPEEENN